MKPPRVREYLIPIEIICCLLRRSSMTAIRTAERRAKSESPLGEIEPVTNPATDAIIRNPLYVRLIDASLINEVLNQATNRIVRERGYDCGIQREATFEPTRNVVFAASFAGLKSSRSRDSTIAGIQAKHNFAEADEVPAAF